MEEASDQNRDDTCPGCGEPLPTNAPLGLCPQCLVQGGALNGEDLGKSLAVGQALQSLEGSGTTIGPYKLLQQIGEGGFGVVYMAEQKQPVKRRVALKIIKIGMDTKQVIGRFEAERQALALMDHPNIAKVLDAGATDRGRPYFVMELVKGVPITQYCDDNKLTTEQRLDLFMDVCSAIQHAHQKGIIHRDVKPSNIMITLHDGRPVPKVIDFGIAKATQYELTEKTLFTQYGQFIGTPAYMSPEQAEMSGLDVDTRSDIYSLGVLLYELLTGRTPLDSNSLLSSAHDEIRRRIKEEEPAKPSTRVSTLMGEELSVISNQRRVEPSRLRNLLRGDLDWIVMKALEKDRTRRYETASALKLDIQRFLHDEPVTAVAPSAWYTLQKFAQRNKGTFAAVTVIAASLILGLGLAIFAFARERVARTEADRRREEAYQQRQKAEANEEHARRLQYAADMRLAQLAIDESNQGLATRILRAHIPAAEEADLRAWEWRYLWSQLRDDALVSSRDSEIPITSVSTSSDGAFVAVGRIWGSVDILDALTLKRLQTLQGEWESGSGARVAFVPNSNLLAVTGRSSTEITLWDVGNWTVLRSFAFPASERYFDELTCSPEGRRLATYSRQGVVRIVSVETGKVEHVFPGFDPHRGRLVFSPDGRRLAAGVRQGRVPIIDLDTGNEVLEIEMERSGNALAFSPDGAILAGKVGSRVALWNSRTGELMGELDGHGSRISEVVFRNDGKTLVSSSEDQTIRVWDLASRQTVTVLKGSRDAIWGMAAVGETDHLVTGAKDGTLARWRLSLSPEPIRLTRHPGIWKVATFSGPDGKMIAVKKDGAVVWGDWRHPDQMQKLEPLGIDNGWPIYWCPEKEILAAFTRTQDRIRIWSNGIGILATATRNPDTWPRSTAFLDSGAVFVELGSKFELAAWDTEKWGRADDKIHMLKTVMDDFRKDESRLGLMQGFRVSPDERLLAIWTRKGYVLWYDLEEGTRLAEARCHREWAVDFAFSPDGKTAASSSTGSRVALWQTEPLGIIDTLIKGGELVAFSPDSARLVTGDYGGGYKIWDVTTCRHLLSFGPSDKAGDLSDVGFLPDGSGVFGITGEGLQIWDAPSLEEIDRSVAGEK
jgi:eukaryotic-like serine/threonine-protein kinase